MNSARGFLGRLTQSWSRMEVVLLGVALFLCLIAGGVALGTFYLLRSPSPVAEATGTVIPTVEGEIGEAASPTIRLSPETGSPGTTVTILGEGWPSQSRIVIYLVPVEPPRYAVNSVVAGEDGRFRVDIIVPSDPRWLDESPVPVLAEPADGGPSAQALLNISSPDGAEIATATPAPGVTRTPVGATVTPLPPQPTPTLLPPPSHVAHLTANTNLNVRSGPGTQYDILGVLLYGQQAEIIGRNNEATWWQISFPGTAQRVGWVSAAFATAVNIGNIPIVVAPPPPPPPPPTPTPIPDVVITDWRGEYFNNLALSGPPLVTRNELAVSFDWGFGSPDPRLPADQFSARWTRTLNFSAGVYRFYTRVDDGVRLWVDGALLIDQWHDSSPVTYQADIYLTEGVHHLRMEYYERYLGAVALLAWERADQFPDWRAEYYNNPDLQGTPLFVRNEPSLNHQWGNGSPDPALPADHFSVRWTRQLYFDQDEYVLRVRSDDGIRLWLDNILVIDRWRDGYSDWFEVERTIPSGQRQVRVEYYERTGNALIEVGWWRKDRTDEPPLAVISSASEGLVGQPMGFDGRRSRRGDNEIVEYRWDFGDGSRAAGSWVSHTYISPGVYRVRLTVIDAKGLEDRTRTEIRIVPDLEETMPPIAIISALITAKVGEPVTLDASSSVSASPIVRYKWDFGDGTGETGRTVTHVYTQPGRYTVKLTVIAENGLRSSAYITVRVNSNLTPLAPVPRIKAPGVAQTGQEISFDASDSTVYSRITSYAWDFGDGGSANGLMVPHRYQAPGLYNVILTLTDEFGQSNSANKQIQIVRAPEPEATPIPVINAPARARVGEAVTFDASASISAVPVDEGGFAWDFGDGSTASGKIVSHAYNIPGNYIVVLTVTDRNNNSNRTNAGLRVEPRPVPPQPQIRGPDRGIVGLTLTFDAKDSQTSSPIAKIEWDLGDGATDNRPTINHVYQAAGTYVVTLKLTDQNGLEGVTQKQLQIEPAASTNPPIAKIEAPATVRIEENIIFDGSASQGDNSLASFNWDFGDGSQAAGAIVQHKYQQAGLYEVTLTVTDAQGLFGSSASQIEILPPATPNIPPVAFIIAPAAATVDTPVTFDGGNSAGTGPETSYTWDFGDGSQGSGITVTHTYSASGVYEVALTASNSTGSDTTTIQITISPVQPAETATPIIPSATPTLELTATSESTPTSLPVEPTATAVAPTATPIEVTTTAIPPTATPVEPTATPVESTATAVAPTATPIESTATAAVPTATAVEPTATPVEPTATAVEPTATPVEPTATAIPPTATPVEPTATPTQPPPPPQAVIEGPEEALVAETVSFDGGFSQAGNPIVSYEWDFGDGSTATGMGVDHVYEAAGDYPVSLTVTDQEGLQDIDTLVINVDNPPTATPPPPTPTPEPPTPTVAPTDTPVLTNTRVLTITPPLAVISSTLQAPVGQPVIFAGGQSQSSSPIIGYRWTLGDGALAFGPRVVHTYTVAGLYTVTLRITNTVGLTDNARQIIQINPPP